MSKTFTATYIGGLDAVVVTLPSGRSLEFKRGESHDVLAIERSALADHPEFKTAVQSADEEKN